MYRFPFDIGISTKIYIHDFKRTFVPLTMAWGPLALTAIISLKLGVSYTRIYIGLDVSVFVFSPVV